MTYSFFPRPPVPGIAPTHALHPLPLPACCCEAALELGRSYDPDIKNIPPPLQEEELILTHIIAVIQLEFLVAVSHETTT